MSFSRSWSLLFVPVFFILSKFDISVSNGNTSGFYVSERFTELTRWKNHAIEHWIGWYKEIELLIGNKINRFDKSNLWRHDATNNGAKLNVDFDKRTSNGKHCRFLCGIVHCTAVRCTVVHTICSSNKK